MKNLVITDTNVLVSETGSRLRRGEGDAAGGRREGGSEPLSPGTKKWRERGNSRRWKGSSVADGGGGLARARVRRADSWGVCASGRVDDRRRPPLSRNSSFLCQLRRRRNCRSPRGRTRSASGRTTGTGITRECLTGSDRDRAARRSDENLVARAR